MIDSKEMLSPICFQNMKLDVHSMDATQVWLLEINSNKFYVEFSVDEDWVICEFQIFGAKWYFEFNIKIIKIIRNIVQNLYSLRAI